MVRYLWSYIFLQSKSSSKSSGEFLIFSPHTKSLDINIELLTISKEGVDESVKNMLKL